jgi:serine/threonine protein kinase
MFELKLPFLATLHTAFQTAKYCYFVLDFLAGGDLLHALSKTGRFSENSAKHIVAELLIAMRQVHDRNYIYRDLKIENVLLDCDGHVHLCDFGLAKKVEKIKDLNYSLCGTPE